MKHARGFTLVEALVALALFALLSVAGVIVLRQALDNQQAVRQHSDEVGRLQRLDSLLRADLGQATRRAVRDPGGQAGSAAFVGATDGDPAAWSGRQALLAFTRAGWDSPQADRPQLLHVRYRLENGALIRQSRDLLDGSSQWQQQTLLDGLEGLELAYHNGQRLDRGWAGGLAELPAAVRLRYRHPRLGQIEHLVALPPEGR